MPRKYSHPSRAQQVRRTSLSISLKPRHQCGFCKKKLPTAHGFKLHLEHAKSCRQRWAVYLRNKSAASNGSRSAGHTDNDASALTNATGDQEHIEDVPMHDAFNDPPEFVHRPLVRTGDAPFDTAAGGANPNDSDVERPDPAPPASNRHPRVEDVPDEEDIGRFVDKYPGPVAQTLRSGVTAFEQWRKENETKGRSRWEPFKDEEEWEMAKWMTLNMGANQVEGFLKLSMIKNHCHMTGSKYSFFKQVDSLPTAAPWLCDEIAITGDLRGENGELLTETVELWRRDPVECIRELIGNPAFRDVMKYAPEKVFTDSEKTSRRFDEMSSGNWWWNIQEKLPPGATVAPRAVILASDQTMLSQFRGDQVAWPVYLSIGNIAKATRRQVKARATVLIGYLPISNLDCFSSATCSLAGYRLYHKAMSVLLETLEKAGTDGVDMVCADGFVRKVFPILAAYIADHPEQCLVTGVMENRCPRGTVHPKERGEATECLLRNVSDTLEALSLHERNLPSPNFDAQGLRPIYQPFWATLPHCDIFACITPDILHQLHKGVFKDHLVKWCTVLVGADELDRRFKAMADVPGLRYFKKGISGISQWTGTEHKEMQKIFVALLAGAVDARVLAVAQAVVDFIYYAQFQVHTKASLLALRRAFETFHENKNIFVETGVRQHFNIPKLHSMMHYLDSIEELGTADGYNTELPERLHIDFAKVAYRAGNRKDYIANMARWLQRQEAVELRAQFIKWLKNQELDEHARSTTSDTSDESGSESEEEVVTYPAVSSISPSLGSQPPAELVPRYYIAKKSPFTKVDLTRLRDSFCASEFLPAFTAFIQKHLTDAPFLPSSRDKYAVYKQIKVILPKNTFIAQRKAHDKIRAIPALPSRGPRKPATPAHFDTALVIEDAEAFAAGRGVGIAGLRIARIRAIFELPPQFGYYPHPLAYIEWYTPFQQYDRNTRMYTDPKVTRTGRQQGRQQIRRHPYALRGAKVEKGSDTEVIPETPPPSHSSTALTLPRIRSSSPQRHDMPNGPTVKSSSPSPRPPRRPKLIRRHPGPAGYYDPISEEWRPLRTLTRPHAKQVSAPAPAPSSSPAQVLDHVPAANHVPAAVDHAAAADQPILASLLPVPGIDTTLFEGAVVTVPYARFQAFVNGELELRKEITNLRTELARIRRDHLRPQPSSSSRTQ
ncbi:hypothetical protein EIP91_011412 [Steccherinum ochraceum]|uniref:C2H2-type domain-containing protein n=1 Tax=Steccherinum ochraceum TaxID=92696 RepID=A0A4R0R4X8_9APHY|nr:hypothetical protein EIP91_011412 [Steccherinum ochraceum]